MSVGKTSPCVAVVLVASSVLAQTSGSRAASSARGTESAGCERALQNNKPCAFQLGGRVFEVTSDGIGRRILRDGVTQEFNLEPNVATLPVADDSFRPGKHVLERVCFSEYRGDPILVVGVTDGWNRGGMVVRLDRDSLSARWRLTLGGPDVTLAAIESKYLYQGAVGFMSKIDLETGRFIWRHERRYWRKSPHFHGFERPDVGPANVTWVEELPSSFGKTPRRAVVDKVSGTMLVQP
jgi:hypothetical protein